MCVVVDVFGPKLMVSASELRRLCTYGSVLEVLGSRRESIGVILFVRYKRGLHSSRDFFFFLTCKNYTVFLSSAGIAMMASSGGFVGCKASVADIDQMYMQCNRRGEVEDRKEEPMQRGRGLKVSNK